eukprot:scaffold16882_cov80-Isochrysis_galbana.AAC.1
MKSCASLAEAPPAVSWAAAVLPAGCSCAGSTAASQLRKKREKGGSGHQWSRSGGTCRARAERAPGFILTPGLPQGTGQRSGEADTYAWARVCNADKDCNRFAPNLARTWLHAADARAFPHPPHPHAHPDPPLTTMAHWFNAPAWWLAKSSIGMRQSSSPNGSARDSTIAWAHK